LKECEFRIFGSEENLHKIIECLKAEFGEDDVIVSGPYLNSRPPHEGDFRVYVVVRMPNDGKG